MEQSRFLFILTVLTAIFAALTLLITFFMNRRDSRREKFSNILDLDISWSARHNDTLGNFERYIISINLHNTGNKKFVIEEIKVCRSEESVIVSRKPTIDPSLTRVIGPGHKEEYRTEYSENVSEKDVIFQSLIIDKKLFLLVKEVGGKEFRRSI